VENIIVPFRIQTDTLGLLTQICSVEYKEGAIYPLISLDPIQSLQHLMNFLNRARFKEQRVTVIIDGLDELPYFFTDKFLTSFFPFFHPNYFSTSFSIFPLQRTILIIEYGEITNYSLFFYTSFFILGGICIREENFERFVNASLDDQLVALLINNKIALRYFYPTFANQEKPIYRRDKLQEMRLDWSPENLLLYGNWVLQKMHQQASFCRVSRLPSFEELIAYPSTRHILEKIRQPRDLHTLMQYLLSKLCHPGGCVATKRDVEDAYRLAEPDMLITVSCEDASQAPVPIPPTGKKQLRKVDRDL